jgi:D-citramalate synthase
VNEARLAGAARFVETSSGKDIASNAPIMGRDVFTQTAGIHADGDAKGDLYTTLLAPERFGRQRRYALGKLSGKASLDHNLRSLGMQLRPEDRELVLRRIVELGDKKHTVVPEDLPYIVADVLKRPGDDALRVESFRVEVDSKGLPRAEVEVSCRGRRQAAQAEGDGGYDAFMNALKKAVRPLGIDVPRLEDFRVRIPPGGRTGALVETLITWRSEDAAEGTFSTLGVDTDQMTAAVIATEKMLNRVAGQRGRRRRTN